MEIITDVKKLNDQISGLGRTDIAGKIHKLAVSALHHRMQEANGYDNTYLAKLLDAVPKGVNGKALKQWVLHYGGVKAKPSKDSATRLKNTVNAEDIQWDEACSIMFTDFKPERKPKAFDAHKAMVSLYDRLNKLRERADNELDPNSKEYKEFVAALDAMAAAGLPENNDKAA